MLPKDDLQQKISVAVQSILFFHLAKACYSDSNALILLAWSHFNMIFSEHEEDFCDFSWNIFIQKIQLLCYLHLLMI